MTINSVTRQIGNARVFQNICGNMCGGVEAYFLRIERLKHYITVGNVIFCCFGIFTELHKKCIRQGIILLPVVHPNPLVVNSFPLGFIAEIY